MDFYNDVLRVASGGSWRGSRTNHVQTFDASDLDHLEEIAHKTFGDGEDLYATLFLGNKAFFVTFRRVDPFHAFEIDDDGNITERAEYVISGWNDYFKPVFGDQRLIGIGKNDEEGWTMAVSLYDITDLSNEDPFIARDEVDASHSWSEASWDDRAFSVLEGVVEVEAEGDVVETGLVLLPFQGWDEGADRHISGVQIFTFSKDTLTRRGFMDHGTPVRRSFQAGEDMPANLSEEELSLFDCADPAEPRELGRVELAPNYDDFLVFGDHGARVKDTRGYWSWWRGGDEEPPPSVVEIVDAGGNPDGATAVATIEVPAGASLHKVGDLLVAVAGRYVQDEQADEWELETTLEVHDLSDPAHPAEAGTLTSRDLPMGGGRYGGYGSRIGGMEDMGGYYPGPWYGYDVFDVHAIGEALVFVEHLPEDELVGQEEVCWVWPRDNDCFDGPGGRRAEPAEGSGSAGATPEEAGEDDEQAKDEEDEDEAPALEECTWIGGGQTCTSLEGAPEVCYGRFQRCTRDAQGETTCEEVAEDEEIETTRDCYERERHRYWSHHTFHVVDLRNPGQPSLGEPVAMDREQEAVSVLADGSDLYASWRLRVEVDNDDRPFVSYWFSRLGLADPGAPDRAAPVNVPGELIAVDGETVYTRDTVWGEEIIEAAVNRLRLDGDVARLEARRRFEGDQVHSILLDGRGHVLVSHRPGHASWYGYGEVMRGGGAPGAPTDVETGVGTSAVPLEEDAQHLTILDAASEDLAVLGQVTVDDWATLKDARAGRALFQVPGGLLVMNLDDADAPYAQAYFATRGWPRRILVEGDDVWMAAGRFGVYRFGLDVFNLLRVE